MGRKSIFPALIVALITVMAVAHLGTSSHPDPGVSRWVNTDRTLPDDPQSPVSFRKVTDTLLANGFQITSRVAKTSPGRHSPYTNLKAPAILPVGGVYDTLIACKFNRRVLFKDLSLKALTAEAYGDPSFWNFAGLQFFEADPMHSTGTVLRCNFAYVNALSKEVRNFSLIVDFSGRTRIEEA